MPRARRSQLIRNLEAVRNSRVICYVTGDRAPTPAQVGDDAVRPIMAVLRKMGSVPKLDFFLYTRGGATDVPWRIVRQLRHHVTDEWNALIPFRANSAGTLIALGADEIVLCGEGELGPIDPSMDIRRIGEQGTPMQDRISVEDVMAYVRFVNERGGLTDQAAVAGAFLKLVDRVDPVTLGNVYRTHSHIRDVARRIISSRKKVPSADTQNQIVSTLAEQVYAHGHAIGFTTAQEMGLPVTLADTPVDEAIWNLFEEYEKDLRLREPLDPVHALGPQDRYTEDTVLAVVESSEATYEFQASLDVRAKRQIPQQLNVSLNLNLQLPAGVQNLPANAQAILEQIIQAAQHAALQQAQGAVQNALNAQAPSIGADVSLRGASWREVP